MRNRNSVLKKVENIEGKLKQLKFCVQRGAALEEYLSALALAEQELEELQKQKTEVKKDLETSKSTLKELEQKMDTISQIYNQLHKK